MLEGARFAYRPGEDVLNGLDIVAEPNQTTALVGPSGGGKSTILGLDSALLRAERGGDRSTARISPPSISRPCATNIAFVSQDVFLFRGSIRDNIALARTGASEAEIVEAARRANAHDFIMSFPTATTPMSASRARSFRAASASASPSPARS